MIVEGLKLMLLGMGVVFVFLILIYFIVTLLGVLLKSLVQAEAIKAKEPSKKIKPTETTINSGSVFVEDTRLVAVITAGIVKHRQKMRQ